MSTQSHKAPIRLALSTGSVLSGTGFGAIGQGIIAAGEVVFNTAMCGYQESLTDPSYMGQILIQTQPMIGNTGANPQDTESAKVQVSGLGVHEYTQNWSNYRSDCSLDAYLRQAGVLGIADIDTRSLTRVLRSTAGIQGILTDNTELTDPQLVEMAMQIESMSGQNLAKIAGCDQSSLWTENLGQWDSQWGGNQSAAEDSNSPKVLLMDFGIKSNIARILSELGCRIEIIEQSTTADQIKAKIASNDAHGLFLSNGPGDPQAVTQAVEMLKGLITDPELPSFPIFGICLGHQLLALAMGASTYKLPFGHRGANHPVHDLESGRIEITSQNHGFAVDAQSMKDSGGVMTHVHLNDGTLAGFSHAIRPIAGVQFHPEGSPGPHDSAPFFTRFLARIKASRKSSLAT